MSCSRHPRVVFSLAAGGLLLVALFLVLNGMSLTARAAPGDLFVTPGGGGDCSQASPCDLETVLTTAIGGDTIYMAQGTYTGSSTEVIHITQSVALQGGWDGVGTGPVTYDPEAYPVTVDAEGQRRGVVIGSGLDVTLEGLTVTNGMATSQGAGLYARNATVTLRAMIFDGNAIDVHATPDTYAYGGGAFVEGGDAARRGDHVHKEQRLGVEKHLGWGLAHLPHRCRHCDKLPVH